MIWISLMLCKNIFVFLDGTWNDEKSNTNIFKMFKSYPGNSTYNNFKGKQFQITSLVKTQNEDKAIYLYGLGTSKNRLRNKIQGLTGYGIEEWVYVAYEFLVRNLKKNDVLRIFGFSRGATSARFLSNYLALYGISDKNLRYNRLQNSMLEPSFQSVLGWIPKITFLGLFDSVLAVSTAQETLHILRSQLRAKPDLSKRSFIDSLLKDIIQKVKPVWNQVSIAFKSKKLVHMSDTIGSNVLRCSHAVAINEYRTMFNYSAINLNNPNFSQVYFSGSHSDLGGSDKSSRSLIALDWMLDQGNLRNFFPGVFPASFNRLAAATIYPILDSYTEPMKGFETNSALEKFLLPVFYRKFERFDSMVHSSVIQLANFMNITLQDTKNRTVISPFLRLNKDYYSGNASVANFTQDLKEVLKL
eukprot:NODE_434_length_8679_cov_0.241142.p2 type:complete len:415 gc:universal NODE_434_length_8679_cov_0.241142:3880-2636(-)